MTSVIRLTGIVTVAVATALYCARAGAQTAEGTKTIEQRETESQNHRGEVLTFKDIVSRPITAMELLSNIKVVLNHHLFLRGDFLNDSNLELFFGSYKVSWNSPRDGRRSADFGVPKIF